MEAVLKSALRKFKSEKHVKNVLAGAWTRLFDEHGKELKDIRGRIGVYETKVDGTKIGVDLIEMQAAALSPCTPMMATISSTVYLVKAWFTWTVMITP